MPATVNNKTLLKAFNQTIQALLDLTTSLNNNSNITVKCSGCGSGGSGSVGSGSPVDSDPTDGYTPGNDPVIDAAKCKRVNYVIDRYLAFLGLWGAVEGLLALGPAEALAAYLLGSGSLAFSSILVAGALTTLFWSVVTLLTGGLVIFSYIVAHAANVNANRQELTCAMYNAATPGDMRQAIIDFMNDHLAGLPQSFVTYHVDAIFSNNVLNGIFNGWTDTGVIAELNAYTPPLDCSGCAHGTVLEILGGWGELTTSDGGTTWHGVSEQDGGAWRLNFGTVVGSSDWHVESWISNIQFSASGDNLLTTVNTEFFLPKPFGLADLEQYCCRALRLYSDQAAFTVDFTISHCA